jgi:hypothetical protein
MEIDLNRILEMLSSDEARVEAFIRLRRKNEDYFPNDKLAQICGNARRLSLLVYAFREAGMEERAREVVILYAHSNLWEAADTAADRNVGMKTVQNLHQRAVENRDHFYEAAQAADSKGKTEIAVINYEKAGLFDKAAEVARKTGMTEKAKVLQTLADLVQ